MHSTEHHRKLNSPKAAEYLGISVSTLSKRRVDGDGPKYRKLGRRVVYDTRDLDDWLDARRRASTSDVDPAPDGCRPRRHQTGSTTSVPERQHPRRKRGQAAAEVGL
jgi:predicted DNA-binding transcriptional regulator AlpA